MKNEIVTTQLYNDVCHIIELGREKAYAAVNKSMIETFSKRYLTYFRQFYLSFYDLQILQTCLQNLTWTHITKVLRVDDPVAMRWYLETASKEMWSVRTLDRKAKGIIQASA